MKFFVLLETGPVERTLAQIERMRETNVIRDETPIRASEEREWSTFAELFEETRIAPTESVIPELPASVGIGRSLFILLWFLILVLAAFVVEATKQSEARLLVLPLSIGLFAMRLRNIGYGGWTCLWLLVPLAGQVLMLLCFVAPPNYKPLGFRESQRQCNERVVAWVRRTFTRLLAPWRGQDQGEIVPRKTVIIIAVAALTVGWLLCYFLSERFRFQSIGGGRMIKTDRWTGEAWSGPSSDNSWRKMDAKPEIREVERKITPEEAAHQRAGEALILHQWLLTHPNGGTWEGNSVPSSRVNELLEKIEADFPEFLKLR